MIKLFITAIESKPDGTAVTLFEDYNINYDDVHDLIFRVETVGEKVFKKLEEVEAVNNQVTSPF